MSLHRRNKERLLVASMHTGKSFDKVWKIQTACVEKFTANFMKNGKF